MKPLLTAVALAMPAFAGAQSYTNPQPTMNMPNYSTLSSTLEGRDPLPPRETAAVKQEKLLRALALRDEALALQQANGGSLSREQQSYLRRKARAILAYR